DKLLHLVVANAYRYLGTSVWRCPLAKLDRRSLLRGGGLAMLGSSWSLAQKTASDGTPLDTGTSELRPVIERYEVELRDLNRVFPLAGSNTRHTRLEKFYTEQRRLLDGIPFDSLSQPGRVDYLLLR